MKKLISFMLSIAMVFAISVPVINADETEFEEFMLMNFDHNGDGVLSQDELEFNDEYAYISMRVEGHMEYRPDVAQVMGCLSIGSDVKQISIFAEGMQVSSLESLFNYAWEGMFLDLHLMNTYIYEWEGNIWDPGKGEISLELSGVQINGDLSKYNDYNITTLTVLNAELMNGNWFTGEHIKNLTIGEDWNVWSNWNDWNDLSSLVQTASNLESATVPAGLARMIPAGAPLKSASIYDTKDSRFTNEDLKNFINNHSELTELSLACTQVKDLSPIKNSKITSMKYSTGYYDTREELFVDGKTLGDYILEQLVKIPSIQSINMDNSDVTDLTPCSGVNKIFISHSSWIDMNYKNNAAIEQSLPRFSMIYKFWNTSYNYADNIIENYKDKKLRVEVTPNKRNFNPGENVIYSVKVTNLGTEAVDVDVYNTYFWKCTIVNGEAVESIKNLEPGKSAATRITVAADNSNYFYGCFLIAADDKIIGAKSYPTVYKSKVITLFNSGAVITKGEPLNIWGWCSQDTKKIEILTSDNELLATIDNSEERTGFNINIDVPEKYLPSDGEISKTLQIKAVATDSEGNKTTSSTISVEILNSSDELELENCHYMSTGTAVSNSNINSPGILFSGGNIIVRAKFSDDITGANLIINDKSYPMTQYTDGMFKGYYRAIAKGITDSDFFNIMLDVTTKSGKKLKMFGGFGRVLIDPSGIISDPDGNPIEGVKVTLQKLADDGETWVDWDAENYMQQNPVYTTDIGYYGWEVIEGTYRIIAEKEGYEKTIVERYISKDMGGVETAITVLPPRFDVDFTMNYADPENPPVRPMGISSAKTSVESVLADMELSADTEGEDVLNALAANLSDNIYLSFKSDTYAKTPSTRNEQGSITGTIIVENISTDEMEEVKVNIPLAEDPNAPEPTTEPTTEPSAEPTTEPSTEPTTAPSAEPTTAPSAEPTTAPTTAPTTEPVTVEVSSYDKETKTAVITAPEGLQDAVVIFASYDENGKLISISVKDIAEAVTANDSFQNGSKVKVLVWKSLADPKPLATAKEF